MNEHGAAGGGDPFSFMNKTVITHNFLMTMTYMMIKGKKRNLDGNKRKLKSFRLPTICYYFFFGTTSEKFGY